MIGMSTLQLSSVQHDTVDVVEHTLAHDLIVTPVVMSVFDESKYSNNLSA
jgi:hypothetical protein